MVHQINGAAALGTSWVHRLQRLIQQLVTTRRTPLLPKKVLVKIDRKWNNSLPTQFICSFKKTKNNHCFFTAALWEVTSQGGGEVSFAPGLASSCLPISMKLIFTGHFCRKNKERDSYWLCASKGTPLGDPSDLGDHLLGVLCWKRGGVCC